MLTDMADELVADLRRFILSYGEHDSACAGYEATGDAAVDPRLCSCGFITRMDELLAAVRQREPKDGS